MDASFAHLLADSFGTPLYIVEKQELIKSFDSLKAFDKAHPRLIIAYPYKANSLREIINFAHSKGLWAEVTSNIELDMAQKSNLSEQKIIFNGPRKTNEELRRACSQNILIFIDNMPELIRLEEIVRQLQIAPFPIGIRVISSSKGSWNKFGFDIDDGSAFEAAKKISKSGLFSLVGVHAHFHSNISDIVKYQILMGYLKKFVLKLLSGNLLDLKYLDVGSGFTLDSPVPLTRKGSWTVPSLAEYADVIHTNFANMPGSLIIEPGRILVSKAVSLLTRVVAVKRNMEEKSLIVDAGLSMIPNREHYEYPVASFIKDGPKEQYSVHGSLCSNYDLLAEKVDLPKSEYGDLLSILNIGAYNIGRAVTWNLPLPGVVMLEVNGEYRLIRRHENIDDVWKSELI